MSAESLLSVITAPPAVPGVAAAASVAGQGGATTFEGLLAEAVAAEGDVAPVEDAKAAADAAQTVPAVPLPVMPMLLVEAETAEAKVEPSVLPGQEPAPAPEAAALLKAAAEPQVLQGPGEAAPDAKAAPAPEVLPVVADPGVPTAASADAEAVTQTLAQARPAAESAAAVAAAVAAATPPPPAPERTTPPPPIDKSTKTARGEDSSKPNILLGPGDGDPPRPPWVEPGAGPGGGRPGLTMKTDGPAPNLDPAAQGAAPAEPVITAGQASDRAPRIDDAAPVAVARDAGLSSLSRATIETTAHLAAQITRRLEGRSTRFEIALTPEGLGRVDVSLDIDADGQLAARLAFDNPVAAMDLRGRVDELRRQLEDQGFKLADDALQFTDRDPQSRGDGFDGRRDRAFARSNRLAEEADLEISAPVAGRWMSLSLTPDRVDLKV